MPLQFRHLDNTSADKGRRQEFLSHANTQISINAPSSYLDRAHTCVAVYQDGQMVGGYALFSGPKLRMFDLLPDHVMNTDDFINTRSREDFLEINLLWFKPEHKSLAMSVHFWSHFWWTLWRVDAPHVIYCFNGQRAHLASKYSLGRCHRLYSGPPANNLDGGATLSHLVFEAFDTKTIPAMYARGLFDYGKKVFRRTARPRLSAKSSTQPG